MAAEQFPSDIVRQLAEARARIAELENGGVSPEAAGFTLESITDPLFKVDRELRFSWLNAAAEHCIGLPSRQVLGAPVGQIFPATQGDSFVERCRLAVYQNTPQEFQFLHQPSKCWLAATAYPATDGGAVVYCRDCTGEKRRQFDLERQALVLEQLHCAYIAADLQGTITSWNRGSEDLFGFSAEEVVGRHMSILYHDADPKMLEQVLREGYSEQEMRHPRKSGEDRYLRLSWSLLRDAAGHSYGVLGLPVDLTAHKNAQQSGKEREDRYKSLIDVMPLVAYITDAQGRTELANRHWLESSGSAVSQGDWLTWLHPEDIQILQPRWLECLASGQPFEAEFRLRDAKGEYKWHLGRNVPVRGDDNAIRHWVCTATDIDARKGAEEALRRSEERLRLASQALAGIVYDWDPRTGVVQRSGDLQNLIGVQPDSAEPSEQWWQARIHPDDEAHSTSNILRNLRPAQTSFETEFRMRHADGHWVDLCDRGFVVRNELHEPVRVVGSTQDISVRKSLERALREINSRLRFQAVILAKTTDAVVAVDREQRITYFGVGAEALYGVKTSDAIGQPLSAVHGFAWLQPEDEERYETDLRDHGSWKGEYVQLLKDGTRLIVSATSNLLSEEFGGGMVSVIRDVTAKRQAEVESRNQAAQLARANEDLLHFAYAVSHDLQAPLRTSISFSQLLALKYKDRLDGPGAEYIRLIVDAGNRMGTMIRDLLELAKTAGSDRAYDPAVPLENSLSMAIENLGSEVRLTAAAISWGPLPVVAGDAGQLTQLFQNLIGNSLKYRRLGGCPVVRISAERNEGEWVISVQDNGIGFEPDQADKIFGVFKRLHSTEYSGTGVGLAICKRIVERRGGRIWAASAPGQGALFAFSIPDAVSRSAMQAKADVSLPVASPEPADVAPTHFEELFQTIDLAQAMIRNLEGTILVWTRGAQRLFGYSEAEALGQQLHQLLRTEFSTPLEEIEAQLLKTGEWKGELKKRKRDGTPVWLATHWALYRDGSGRPQSIIEVASDINALKEVQEQVKRSGEQRDLALSVGRMGVWRWDQQAGVIEWDEMVERLHGLEPGSFKGTIQEALDRVHPDDRAKITAKMANAVADGPDYVVEYRALRADGTYAWLHGQGQVIHEGASAGIVGVVRDVSDRKQESLNNHFLLDLGSQLMRASNAAEMLQLAVGGLGRYLDVSRCSFGEVDLTARQFRILEDYHPDRPTMRGVAQLKGLEEAAALLEAGRTVSVNDVFTDPLTAAAPENVKPPGTRSFLMVPLHREGKWRAYLSVSQRSPRTWDAHELALVQAVAERVWPALVNLRLRQEFEGTFEQAAVGIAHVSLEGRWLRINQRVCEITGYTREELLTSQFQDITHPDDLTSDVQQFEALQRGETRFYSLQKRYFHKDGSTIWINLTVSLVRDPDDAPLYAISVIEDIAAHKKAEQELTESNRLREWQLREIEAIYSQAPVGLAYLDRDLRFVRINHHLAGINNVPAENHIGRTPDEVLPEMGARLSSILKGVVDTGIPVREVELQSAGAGQASEERTWLVSCFPFARADGSLVGLNAVVQEITERKQTERAWIEASDRLWIATSAAQLGVFVWESRDDRVYWENQRMYSITGRSRDEGPANAEEFVRRVVLPEDATAFQKALRVGMVAGQSFRHACRIVRGDGAIRHVEFSGEFESVHGGAHYRLTGVMADITDRVEAERATFDRRQLLLKVLDSLSTFVGVMSPDGRILEANRAPLQEGAAIEPDEVVGKLLPDMFWWAHSPAVQSRLWDAIYKAQAGGPSRFDIPARMRDGQQVTVDWTIAPLRDETGTVVYLIASAVPIEERKQAEAALRKSEERYLLAEWATSDGLWDWDTITGYCYFSPRFKALLGLVDDELENRATAVFKRLHPEDEHVLYENVRLHFEEGRPYDIEIRAQLKDGSYRWFRSRGRAVRDEAGAVVRMVGSMADIHDRKQTDIAAKSEDEQLRQMVDNIGQLAWIARADGQIVWCNQRWYDYTGTTLEQLAGVSWRAVQDPQQLSETVATWQRAIQIGRPFEMEYPIRGKDGVLRSFLTRIVPLRDAHGAIVKWFGTNTDIDILRKEQDLLKESERQFRELAETLPELVWVADPHGATTYANPQFFNYTGLRATLAANQWLTAIHPDDAARHWEAWQESLKTLHVFELQSRVRRFDGAYRWFLHRAKPVRDGNGNVIKWLGTGTDIHGQKMTEEALRRSNEDLEQFTYAASHDLQEPLRTVSIYSQLIWEKFGSQTGQQQQFARYIVGAAKQMEGLLKGLMSYSRTGDVVDGTARTSSSVALAKALQNLDAAIQQAGAVITHGQLPDVAVDEEQLIQLFQNLIANAIKYRQEGAPAIRVTAFEEGTWQKFSIADNGIGIRKEYLQQIFGVFKRLHRSEYPGVGVGLAICKRIVERHGGHIWADSEVGQGTTLWFLLPAALEE